MIDFLGKFTPRLIKGIEVLYEAGKHNYELDEEFPSKVTPLKYLQPSHSSEKRFLLQGIATLPLLIRKVVHLNKKDVTISSTIRGGLAGLFIKNLSKTHTLVYDDMDYYPFFYYGQRRYYFVKKLEEIILSQADIIFSVSKSLMNLRKKEHHNTKPIFFLPNGVDAQLFEKAWKQKKVRRRESSNTLVYAGSLDPSIWSSTFVIDILKELNKNRNVRLIMIGGGPLLPKLIRTAKERNVQDKIIFTGSVPHIILPAYFRLADIGLAIGRPGSAAEFADPIKVKEYMAAGLPVIGTNVGDIPNVIEECECGIVAEYDLESIVNAILVVLTNSQLYNEMQRKARVNAAKKYDWRYLFEKMFQIILELT